MPHQDAGVTRTGKGIHEKDGELTTENTETRRMEDGKLREKELTEQIIGAAIEVHRFWGPGLYKEIYERSLCHELRLRNLPFDCQLPLALLYKGARVGDD